MKRFFKILLLNVVVIATTSFVGADVFSYEPKLKLVQCYPNPATSVINFETSTTNSSNLTISIYNFIGKKVDEYKLNSGKVSISLESYYRGLYIYQLRSKQGELLESGKFQINK